MKCLFFLWLLCELFLISSVLASPLQVGTIYYLQDQINLTIYSPNLTSQIVIEVPAYVTHDRVGWIDQVEIQCGYVYSNPPDGNYNVRILYRDSSNPLSGWGLINGSEYYNVPATGCTDSYGGILTVILDGHVYIDGTTLFGLVNKTADIGIGIATTSTNGAALAYANKSHAANQTYHFTTPANVTEEPIVLYVNGDSVMNGNDTVDWSPIHLYGGTPTPTPTPTPGPTENGTPVPTTTMSPCPPGNSSCTPYQEGSYLNLMNNSLPNGSHGFKEILEGNGYQSNVGGAISVAKDYMFLYVIVGMLLFMGRLWGDRR